MDDAVETMTVGDIADFLIQKGLKTGKGMCFTKLLVRNVPTQSLY